MLFTAEAQIEHKAQHNHIVFGHCRANAVKTNKIANGAYRYEHMTMITRNNLNILLGAQLSARIS